MPRIITVASGKGGVGKTITVANLGTVLATRFNKNVVVVDCNLSNPHLGLYMGSLNFWPVTLNDVLKNQATLDQAMYRHQPGLHIIPASFEPRNLIRMNTYRLRSRLHDIFEDFKADIVLLDSPPGLSRDSIMTYGLASEIIFVATPHIPAIVDIQKCCQQLNSKDAKPIGIVVNRVRNRKYELTLEEIAQFTNLPILARIPEDEHVLRSTNFKVPVATLEPKAKASRAFVELAENLLGEKRMAEKESGFFSRIFGKK